MRKIIIVFCTIVVAIGHSNAQSIPSYIDTNHLTAWYPFNGDADDESGKNLDGTANGASLTLDRNGNSNSAYYFDGVDDFIELPSSLQLDNSNDGFTISLWYYLDTTANYSGGILELQDDLKSSSNYSLDEISIKSNYGKVTSRLNRSYRSGNTSGSSSGGSNQSLTLTNQWVNIVSVFNTTNRNVTMYVNGYKLGANSSGSYSFNSLSGGNSGTRKIGSTVENLYNPQYWKGQIDDVIIWNRTLPCNEVSSMYAQASGTNYNDFCFASIDSTSVSCTNDYQLSITSDSNLDNVNSLKIQNGYACGFNDYDIWSTTDDYAVAFWFKNLNTDSVTILSNNMGLSMGGTENRIILNQDELAIHSGSFQSNLNSIDTGWNHIAMHIRKNNSVSRSILYVNGNPVDSVNNASRLEEFSFGDIHLEQINQFGYLIDNVVLIVGDSVESKIQNIYSNCSWSPASSDIKRFYSFENSSSSTSSFIDQISMNYSKKISGNNYSGNNLLNDLTPYCSEEYSILWNDGNNQWSRVTTGGTSYSAIIYNSTDTNTVSIVLPAKTSTISGYVDLFPDTIISYGNTIDTVVDWLNWPPDTSIVYGAGYKYTLPQNSYSYISPLISQNASVNNSEVRFETSGIHKFYLSDWGFSSNSCNKEESVFVEIIDSINIVNRKDVCDTMAEFYPVNEVNQGILRLKGQSLKCTDISPFQDLENLTVSFHLYWQGGTNQTFIKAPGLLDVYSISNNRLLVTDYVDTLRFNYPLLKWKFLTITSNLNELSVWVNDSLVQSLNRSRNSNLNLNTGFSIGRDIIYNPLSGIYGVSGSNYSTEPLGGLNEVSFWNSSLDSTSISNHVFALDLQDQNLISSYDFDVYGINPEDQSYQEKELYIFNFGSSGGYISDQPDDRKILQKGSFVHNSIPLLNYLTIQNGQYFNLIRLSNQDTIETYSDSSDSPVLIELARLQGDLNGLYCSLDSIDIPLEGSYDSVQVNGVRITDSIFSAPSSAIDQVFSIVAYVDSISCSYEIKIRRYEPLKDNSIWNDTLLCNTSSSILRISNYDSNWINDLPVDSIVIVSDTNLIVESIDSSGCSRFDTINIEIDSYDSSLIVNTDTFCSTDSALYIVDADLSDVVTWNSPRGTILTGANQFLSDTGQYNISIARNNGCNYTDSIYIGHYNPVYFNSSIILDSIICGTELIEFIPSGYDYVMIGGIVVDTITVDSILENSITIVSQDGCLLSDSIRIILDSYDFSVLGAIDSTCFGIPKILYVDSSSISTLSWSKNSALFQTGGFSVNALDTGLYTAEIVSFNGCSYEDSTQLYYFPKPSSVNTVSQVSCAGSNTGSINISAINSDLIWWSNNLDNSFTQDSLYAGTYYFNLSNNYGCVSSDSVTLINPAILSYNSNKSDITCFASNNGGAEILFNNGVSPYYTFWLDNADSTNSRINLSPGTYSVEVGDNSTCPPDTVVFVLTEPDSLYISLQSITDVNCFNGQDGQIGFKFSGGGNSAVASLKDSAGNIISKTISRDSSAYFQNIIASNYTLHVIDSNGCADSLVVFISQPSSSLNVVQTSNSSFCQGDSTGYINLTISGGTPPYSTIWNTNDTASSLNNLPDGNYSFTTADLNMCSVQGFKTLFTSPLIPADTTTSICLVSITDSLKSLIAWEKPISMNGIASFEIMKLGVVNWSSAGIVNAADSSFFIDNNSTPSSKAQTYGIRIVDSCNNTWGTYATNSHTTSLLQSSIGTSGQVNLTWTPYLGVSTSYYRILRRTTSNAFTAIDSVNTMTLNYVDNFPPTGSTVYAIEGVLGQSCTISAKNGVISSYRSNYVTEQTIGLDEILKQKVIVFPNPTSNVLHITYPEGMDVTQIAIVDARGKIISQSIKADNDIDVSQLSSGIYILSILIEGDLQNISFEIIR